MTMRLRHALRSQPYFEHKKGSSVPAFEVVLRRSSRPDRVRYLNEADAQIGDVLEFDGRPWVIVAKEPPFELRRIERLICVPRTVQTMH